MRRAILPALACCLAAASPPPLPPALAPILARARAASGGSAWDRLTFTRNTGTMEGGGEHGTIDTILDWKHPRFVARYTLGSSRGAQGWNGTTTWSTDKAGHTTTDSSPDAIAGAVQGAYLATYAMFSPARYPATVRELPPRTDAGTTFDIVTITPARSHPVELWFDAATHLPARAIDSSGKQLQTVLFSDFRPTLGVRLPFHVVIRTQGQPDQTEQKDSYTEATATDATFAPPP